VQHLRALQGMLAEQDGIQRALRSLGQFYPGFLQKEPVLAKRLATCIYWLIIDQGTPEDAGIYTRVFGPPPDDPHFHRARALVNERQGAPEEAYQAWQDYEKTIQSLPWQLSEDQLRRARALLWERIGESAAHVPDMDRLQGLMPGGMPFMPKPPVLEP